MAEMVVALFGFRGHHLPHFHTVVAVKCIAFNEGGIDAFAIKNAREGTLHRSGARTG